MKNGKSSVPNQADSLGKKITEGIQKATQKMIEKAALLDEEVVISRNGKVQRVKAKELVSGLPSAE